MDRYAIQQLVQDDLAEAHPDDRRLFASVAVEPTLMPIVGDSRHERVWVVAAHGNEVVFYDDVEEGFNVSALNEGTITEPGYSQDSLGATIHNWLQQP